MALQIEPRYPVSMTGIQGSGKKTLRDGIASRLPGFVAVELELLKLGRMVDLEGLKTFRERYLALDLKVKEASAAGHFPVTQRLGILDVAIIAEFMSRAGRVDRVAAASFLDEVKRDASFISMPSAMVWVRCGVDGLLERLHRRDEENGVKLSRAAKPLAALQSFLDGVRSGTESTHPLIMEIVDHYRTTDLVLTIDTTDLDPIAAQDRVIAFLQKKQICMC
jgi:hypothetical protein